MVYRITKKVLFISTKSPYSSDQPKELLDLMLAASALEQKISILFADDGVYQLQKYKHLRSASLISCILSLPLYSIENIAADSFSLTERKLSADSLAIKVQIWYKDDIKNHLHDNSIIVKI